MKEFWRENWEVCMAFVFTILFGVISIAITGTAMLLVWVIIGISSGFALIEIVRLLR